MFEVHAKDSNRSMNLSSRIREREAFANITRAARALEVWTKTRKGEAVNLWPHLDIRGPTRNGRIDRKYKVWGMCSHRTEEFPAPLAKWSLKQRRNNHHPVELKMSSPKLIRPLCGDGKMHEARGNGVKGLAGTMMAKIVD